MTWTRRCPSSRSWRRRAKPGGEAIPVTIGDFADFRLDGRFDLIFAVFNTFFALLTQEQQVQCFARAAAHLSAAGVFLIGESGTLLYPVRIRYAWPTELDLMARLAGLRLRDRWSGWDRAPFTSSSTSHVSVYEFSP